VLARGPLERELKSLSQAERRALKALGVRIAPHALFLSTLLSERGRPFARAFALQAAGDWRPAGDGPQRLSGQPARALGFLGLAEAGEYAVPVEQLERLDALLRGASRQGDGVLFSDHAREELGWTEAEARGVLKGLGYRVVGRPAPGEPVFWRRQEARPDKAAVRPMKVNPNSPFAALEALRAPPPKRRRPRRRGGRTGQAAPKSAHG
jgi:ATP-dependent RNA helicase SUPV3L1/SUV3